MDRINTYLSMVLRGIKYFPISQGITYSSISSEIYEIVSYITSVNYKWTKSKNGFRRLCKNQHFQQKSVIGSYLHHNVSCFVQRLTVPVTAMISYNFLFSNSKIAS